MTKDQKIDAIVSKIQDAVNFGHDVDYSFGEEIYDIATSDIEDMSETVNAQDKQLRAVIERVDILADTLAKVAKRLG